MSSIAWSGKFDERGRLGHCSKCFISWIEGPCYRRQKRRISGWQGEAVVTEMNYFKKRARENFSPALLKVRAITWSKPSFFSLHWPLISKMLEKTVQAAAAPIEQKPDTARTQNSHSYKSSWGSGVINQRLLWAQWSS